MTKHHAVAPAASPPLADDGPGLEPSSGQDLIAPLARGFVEAFNGRDADALVALAHPRIVFRPTSLVGRRRTYDGHAGLRRWIAELDAMGMDLQLQTREIRPLTPSGFLVLS
ncbi:MAG TPA: nuclear transport factor 2 family protein, partial [Conexibacter sp.]|nr:nuclear transport factor 2 family protein [Conexibacter sp.]